MVEKDQANETEKTSKEDGKVNVKEGTGKTEKEETVKPQKSAVALNATAVAAPVRKNLRRRHFPKAKAYILCSYNNTSITISDLNGNVLGWGSAGSLGFKGPKKSTPFAATLVAQKVVEKTARFGIKEMDIFIKGVGGGREASVRALGNTGIMVNSIKDVTPVPHNGCRPKKPRRV